MEEDQELKHVCKLCNKRFSCGRSLGGHMRSHVINSSDHENQEKLNKKKLSSMNNNGGIDGYGLREKPRKKICRFANSSEEEEEEETLIHDKCSKRFQSCKALFGHIMKCHSEEEEEEEEEDSWLVMDSQSDTKTAVGPTKRKRSSRRVKRYLHTTPSSSSVSEIEQKQEEIAMCLIMLSRDKGNRVGSDSVGGSFYNNSQFSDSAENPQFDAKKSDFGCKLNKSKVLVNGFLELDSENGFDQAKLGSKKIKFECTSCNRTFHSYQALGGHRASHKKIKGCFASKTELIDNRPIDSKTIDQEMVLGLKKSNKGHECPICFKVFSSGQALGGHKRSHLIGGEDRIRKSFVVQNPIQEIREHLDLNLPAPVEEEINGHVWVQAMVGWK